MNEKMPVTYPENARTHIALRVGNLERSIEFYRLLLGIEPTKVRECYAKFEPENPSLNLALNEVSGSTQRDEGLSHFGIQVDSTDAVKECAEKLEQAGLKMQVEDQVTCCFAVQDKIWVEDPDGNHWEVFVVTQKDTSACCEEQGERKSVTACC